jgi:hypothetical protein
MRQTLSEWAGGPLGQVQRERKNFLSLVRVAVPGIIESFDADAEFQKILAAIAHNVPAVCDVLPARIRALRSKDQGWQNVGRVEWSGVEWSGVERGMRSRPSETEPRAACWRRSVNSPVMCSILCPFDNSPAPWTAQGVPINVLIQFVNLHH